KSLPQHECPGRGDPAFADQGKRTRIGDRREFHLFPTTFRLAVCSFSIAQKARWRGAHRLSPPGPGHRERKPAKGPSPFRGYPGGKIGRWTQLAGNQGVQEIAW